MDNLRNAARGLRDYDVTVIQRLGFGVAHERACAGQPDLARFWHEVGLIGSEEIHRRQAEIRELYEMFYGVETGELVTEVNHE